MKKGLFVGGIVCLLLSCLREKYTGEDCWREVNFHMQDVPYALQPNGAVEYRPYSVFTEQLDLFVFAGEKLWKTQRYDYNYCQTHSFIPLHLERYQQEEYLFVANLYDPKELDWAFVDGRLRAWFSIVNYEEPPVLLAATSKINERQDTIPVELLLMISRLEIRLTNPPVWVSGLNLVVRDVAASVTTGFHLSDTTHIQKQVWFENQGAGTYEFGLNTFPTYPDRQAALSINLLGTSEATPILVEDSRLKLLPGYVTRLEIAFETESKITVSIEVHGKWEIVDGGHIII